MASFRAQIPLLLILWPLSVHKANTAPDLWSAIEKQCTIFQCKSAHFVQNMLPLFSLWSNCRTIIYKNPVIHARIRTINENEAGSCAQKRSPASETISDPLEHQALII